MPPETNPSASLPRVEGVPLGPFQTNCYLVWNPAEGGDHPECWIVDAGYDPSPLLALIRKHGLRPTRLILTHAHADHIAEVADVFAALGEKIPVMLHPAEHRWLNDPALNLSEGMGIPITAPGPDEPLNDGDELTLGSETWKVIHTPGHSPGGVTLYHAGSKQALVGDTLFAGSIGRYDFPTSDAAALEDSIKRKLYALPNETVVYPGHGPTTTIGEEAAHNPFVRRD